MFKNLQYKWHIGQFVKYQINLRPFNFNPQNIDQYIKFCDLAIEHGRKALQLGGVVKKSHPIYLNKSLEILTNLYKNAEQIKNIQLSTELFKSITCKVLDSNEDAHRALYKHSNIS